MKRLRMLKATGAARRTRWARSALDHSPQDEQDKPANLEEASTADAAAKKTGPC
jgi:hypothetical protein